MEAESDDGRSDCSSIHDVDNEEEKVSEGLEEDVKALEKVINAIFYYKFYLRERIGTVLHSVKRIPPAHQKLLSPTLGTHLDEVAKRIDHNQQVLNHIIQYGVGMFGDLYGNALRIHQKRRPELHLMSNVVSSIRQIVREWSTVGRDGREKTYGPIKKELERRFSDVADRANVRVLLPGAGLGRLCWDLVEMGFCVQGNENSLLMLVMSSFLLNSAQNEEELTIYPYILDKSNSWSFSDQLRPVTFPDLCPTARGLSPQENAFSMCAGDFLQSTRDDEGKWDVLVSSWFIDTANNIIDYIEQIYRILKPGGTWLNVGPLTYHYEDIGNEISIELPYEEIMRIVRHAGFVVDKEERIDSLYTDNDRSMLHNHYTCAFFVVRKPFT